MSSGPAALQRKQMRHCWFTLMLYCPQRSPRSFSSRLPGGILASSRVSAASNINSLRSAARWVCWSSRRERSRRQTRSVSLSAKERSTNQYNATRYYRATLWACPVDRGGASRLPCPDSRAARRGEYRVSHTIEDSTQTVQAGDIRHRRNTYSRSRSLGPVPPGEQRMPDVRVHSHGTHLLGEDDVGVASVHSLGVRAMSTAWQSRRSVQCRGVQRTVQ